MAENIDDKKEVVKPEEKSGLSVLKKILIGVVVVTVFILGVAYWIGTNEEYVTKKIEDWRAERYEKALKKYSDEMRVKYMADKDGGKTPEETIELFITALKAGDIEKASKYYVLDDQKEQTRLLERILEEDKNFNKMIANLEKIKKDSIKSCGKNYNYRGIHGCVFTHAFIANETSTTTAVISGQKIDFVVPKGSADEISFSVIENVYSGVWKVAN